MANVSAPYGLRPLLHGAGGIIRYNQYGNWSILNTYNTAIYFGDVVSTNSTNKWQLEKGVPSTADFVGVFAGVKWTASNGEPKFSRYWPGSAGAGAPQADVQALVYDDPRILFAIQSDVDSFAQTNFGKKGDVTASTTGSTLTGLSNMTLDTSTIGSDSNLWVIDYIRAPDNAIGDSYVNCVVRIHEHRFV